MFAEMLENPKLSALFGRKMLVGKIKRARFCNWESFFLCRQKADGPVVELLNDGQIKTSRQPLLVRRMLCQQATHARHTNKGPMCTACALCFHIASARSAFWLKILENNQRGSTNAVTSQLRVEMTMCVLHKSNLLSRSTIRLHLHPLMLYGR